MCNCKEVNKYPVGDIAQALVDAVALYNSIDYHDEFADELEITVLGLIKSLRIAAFHSSEKS